MSNAMSAKEVTPTTIAGGVVSKVAGWVTRQTPWVVMSFVLLGILGGLMWGGLQFGYYVLNQTVPSVHAKIEEGLVKARAEHKEHLQMVLQHMEAERKRDRDWASLEREKDRNEWVQILRTRGTSRVDSKESGG